MESKVSINTMFNHILADPEMCVPDEQLYIDIQIIGADSVNRFRELVHRAVNLWPDAHPEIKEFADLVTEGRVQQDYSKQEYYKLTSKPKED
jgi:hypothetical protein